MSTTDYSTYADESSAEGCSLCAETYDGALRKKTALPCMHVFCKQCVDKWWEAEEKFNKRTCPECRHDCRPALFRQKGRTRKGAVNEDIVHVYPLPLPTHIPLTEQPAGSQQPPLCKRVTWVIQATLTVLLFATSLTCITMGGQQCDGRNSGCHMGVRLMMVSISINAVALVYWAVSSVVIMCGLDEHSLAARRFCCTEPKLHFGGCICLFIFVTASFSVGVAITYSISGITAQWILGVAIMLQIFNGIFTIFLQWFVHMPFFTLYEEGAYHYVGLCCGRSETQPDYKYRCDYDPRAGDTWTGY